LSQKGERFGQHSFDETIFISSYFMSRILHYSSLYHLVLRSVVILNLLLVCIWFLSSGKPARAQDGRDPGPPVRTTTTVITKSLSIHRDVAADTTLLAPLSPRFTHLTIDDGLTNNDITALLQDRQGFLWVGTRDGLNRYDGYTVITYRHEPGNPYSLPRNEVRTLFEDRDGTLWIATNDGGVTRYDPRLETFETLRHEADNPQSLGGNLIFSIHQTTDGNLWFGGPSVSGLTRYDPTTKTFSRYRGPAPGERTADLDFPRGTIMRMYNDHQDVLWLLTETALARYDATADRFQVYEVSEEQRPTAFLHTLIIDESGHFWVGGGGGLYQFEQAYGRFTPIADAPARIEVLHRDPQGVIWVGAASGLYQFDPTTQQTQLAVRHDAAVDAPLTDSNVTALLSDQNGLLWIGTRQGGLNRLDPKQQQFVRYGLATTAQSSLNAPRVQGLVDGGNGEFWAANGQTLYRLQSRGEITDTQAMQSRLSDVGQSDVGSYSFSVTQYPLPKLKEASEVNGGGEVRLLRDHRGHLWLGLVGTVVLEFDPDLATFTQYELLDGPLRPGPPPAVVALVEDDDHNLWFAVSFVGIYRLDATRAEVTAFRYRGRPDFFNDTPDNIASAAVMAMTGDTDGNLWLGYHDGTITRFTPKDERFTHYPSLSVLTRDAANSTQPVPPGDRLPSAGQGPPPVRTKPRQDLSPEALAVANPSGWVEALYWDASANLLWIGERNGLVRFDPATEAFIHYGTEAGLTNTFIVSIAQDQAGVLWLGTQYGLIRFDPERASAHTYTAHTYTVADGLQDNQFNRLAALHSTEDRMFFGGATGITSFDPSRLVGPADPAPVLLTNMRLYNVPVTVGADSPLQEALWAMDALTLQPDQQVVSFEFAALNFAAPNQNRYRYRLEGLESSWNEVADDRRFATYTSLHPGTYTFRVQGGDSNGDWYPTETTLTVRVLPQWWQTLWFRLLAVGIIMGALFGGYRYRTHAIAVRNRLLEQQVAERTAALQESEERFRGLSTSAFEAILIQQEGIIVDANEAATRLFGYAHETLVGLPITTLLQPLLPATVGDTAQIDAPDQYEMEGVQFDGRIIPLEVHMRTIPYQGQEALVVALRDLTERRATERQRQQLAALEERERIGRDLHDDLGQVMGYISMQAQTAQELLKQEKPIQAQGMLQELTEAAQSAHSSVRQFILGIRNGRAPSAWLDLFTALDLYLDQVRERHGLTVQVSLPDDVPALLLSTQVETQLLRIIQEAIANVVKHAGVDVARIVFLLQPDELQVIVSDEGRGFALPPSSNIATALTTSTHAPRNSHSAGSDQAQNATAAIDDATSPLPSLHFGLDIMRERAESVGGKLEVRSTAGRGTQVLIMMPRRLDLQPQEELRGLRVLLADDHPLYREGLRNMLSVRGIHVVGIAEDGHEAEQLAHQLLPDLILMDIEMPNCDGVAATKAIKAALPTIKIVMLTVAAGTETLLTALKYGASGYLLKNLATEQFFALLSEVLQGETVLSPKLTTSMVSTLTADQLATEAQNGAHQELTTQAARQDQTAIIAQIQQLTTRQREVLDLVVQGLTNKEIARELHITERTVKYHVGLILEQMGVQSRYDLIHLAQSVAGLMGDGESGM